MPDISKITIPGDNGSNYTYDIKDATARTALTGSAWDATARAAAAAGFSLKVVQTLPTASASTMKAIYLVAKVKTETQNVYEEYVTVESGTTTKTYAWEKIGDTSVDLSDYVTWGSSTDEKGGHTHTVTGTVTVPTVSADATYISGSASGTAVGADGTDTFVKSYPGASSKLATTSIVPTNGSVSIPNVTGNSSVTATNTVFGDAKVASVVTLGNALSASNVSKTDGSAASWGATVSDETLAFSWTANVPTAVSVSGVTIPNVTKVEDVSVPTVTSNTSVTATNTTLGTAISAAKLGTAVTVATGSLDSSDSKGASVMTGLGTATTASALTGVKVTTQPTISLKNETASATGRATASGVVTVGSTSSNLTNGSAATAGAHKHTVPKP